MCWRRRAAHFTQKKGHHSGHQQTHTHSRSLSVVASLMVSALDGSSVSTQRVPLAAFTRSGCESGTGEGLRKHLRILFGCVTGGCSQCLGHPPAWRFQCRYRCHNSRFEFFAAEAERQVLPQIKDRTSRNLSFATGGGRRGVLLI